VSDSPSILPLGLPEPVPQPDGLDAPYWEGVRRHELLVQRCNACRGWQWGPEWICHHCLSFDIGWDSVVGEARIFSWERVWHPVHPGLSGAVPYTVLLVEFPESGGIRMVGNLVGDPEQDVPIGATVLPAFEDHDGAEPPFTLVQWKLA